MGWRERLLVGVAGRHAGGGIGRRDALVELAVIGVAGHDGGASGGFEVEAEFGFARSGVGAVTGEAAVREDGPDVAIEFDWLTKEGKARQTEEQGYSHAGFAPLV